MKNKFKALKGGKTKMNQTEIKGEKPDYTGKLEVSAWLKKDKNNKTYLSVKIGSYANLFKNELKIEDQFN